MARPQKQTVDYFPHIAHSEASDTLTVLENKFGNNGYAFWFKLLERLALSEGHYIDCRNEAKWQVLLARLGADEVSGKEMMFLLVEMGAIDKDLWASRVIWCDNFIKNVASVYKNRKQELPQRPVITTDNPISTTDNPVSTPTLPVETPQSRVNKSRVNKSKEDSTPAIGEMKNVHLSSEEYDKLVLKFGTAGTAQWVEVLSLAKASKGYKSKSDYATILNWQRRDAEKNNGGQNGTGTNQGHVKQYTDPDEDARQYRQQHGG